MPISKKEGEAITSSILFTFGEMGILKGDSLYVDPRENRQRPPHLDAKAIINGRIDESNRQITKVREVRAIAEKSYSRVQKIGEPDWNEVKRDAERKLGRKLLGEEQ